MIRQYHLMTSYITILIMQWIENMNTHKQKILAEIKDILVDIFELDEADIVPEAKLYDDLDIDSIDAVDLLIDMKKRVNVDISSEQFNQVNTIQDVVDVFAALSSEQSAQGEETLISEATHSEEKQASSGI